MAKQIQDGAKGGKLDAKSAVSLALGAEYTNVVGGINIIGAHAGWDINREAGIENQYKALKNQMFGLADEVSRAVRDRGATTLKAAVSGAVGKRFPNASSQEIEKATNALLSFLAYVEEEDLKIEQRRLLFADRLSTAYLEAWRNTSLKNLDGKTYFGGLSVDISRIAGTPVFAGSVGGIVKKSYTEGQRETAEYQAETSVAITEGYGNRTPELLNNKTKIDAEIVRDLNQTLGLHGTNQISLLDDGTVKIPASLAFGQSTVDIVLDSAMKKHMKKDEAGNILLSPQTPLRSLSRNGAYGHHTILNIGAEKSDIDALHLKDITSATDPRLDGWF